MLEHDGLVGRLHALGEDVVDAEAAHEGHDGRELPGGGLLLTQAGDEGPVEFDVVDRQAQQRRERGVAGAEVVDEHDDALPAQVADRLEHVRGGVDEHRLGHLEPHGVQRQPGLPRTSAHHLGEPGVEELGGGDVDGDRDITHAGAFAPDAGEARARLTHREFAEFPDEPEFLGEPDEHLGGDGTEFGLVPAQEGLPGEGRVEAGATADGLEVDAELLLGDRSGEPVAERGPDAAALGQGLVEEHDLAGGAGLRLVHGDVGAAEHLLCVHLVGGQRQGGADGDRHRVLASCVDDEGFAQGGAHAVGERERGRLIGDVGDDDELVAAVAGEGVPRRQARREARRDLAQEVVPGGVTPGVVDVLEVVAVDEDDRRPGRPARIPAESPGEGLEQRRPVEQPGEGVVGRAVPTSRLRAGQGLHGAGEPDEHEHEQHGDERGAGDRVDGAVERDGRGEDRRRDREEDERGGSARPVFVVDRVVLQLDDRGVPGRDRVSEVGEEVAGEQGPDPLGGEQVGGRVGEVEAELQREDEDEDLQRRHRAVEAP